MTTTQHPDGELAQLRPEDMDLAPARRRRAPLRLAALAVRKIGVGLLVLWAAATVVFFAMHLAPGSILDVVAALATSELARTEAAAEWGLDQPLHVQYLQYLVRLLHGDLGHSYALGQPVIDVILERAPASLELTFLSILIALALAFSVVILTGTGSPVAAKIFSFVELVLVSMPSFWLGILLMFFVSFKLQWLPVIGTDRHLVLILPALTLGLRIAGELIQIMRSAIARTLDEPFTLSARARGISDIAYSYHHAIRHASLPVITVTGSIVGSLLTNAFVIEQLFGRTGIGTLTVKAVLLRDIPVVVGVALVAAAIYIAISTLVDILYVLVDPRLRTVDLAGGH